MRLREIFDVDSDYDHRENLAKNGFWGKRGAGGILYAQNSHRFLVAFRSGRVEQPHTIGTIGGAIDSEENELVAVIREMTEELGVTLDIIGNRPIYRFEKKNDDGEVVFTYQNFIIIIPEEIPPQHFTLNWENDSILWATIEQLNQIKTSGKAHFGLSALLNDPSTMAVMRSLARGGVTP